MHGLTLGKDVYFIQQLPGQVSPMQVYAAKVSHIYGEHYPEDYPPGSIEACADRHTDGDVQLHVFGENSVFVKYDVPFSAEKLPNTWHWPEKA